MTAKTQRLLTGFVAFAAGLALVLPGAASGAVSDRNLYRASFRISGGAGFALNGGGDLELQRLGIGNYFTDIAGLSGYTSSINYNRMSIIPDVEVDVIFSLTDNLQCGIGAGYIRAQSKGDYSYDYTENGTASWGSYTYKDGVSYNRDYVVSAIPLRLTLYYTVPAGKLDFFVYGGVGFYLGSLKHTYSMNELFNYEDFSSVYLDEKYEVTATAEGTETSKKNALGFHGGVGLELKLGRNMGLAVEAFGRFVNFAGWNGTLDELDKTRTRSYLEGQGWYDDSTTTDKFSETGQLWYYEYLDPDLNKKYAYMQTFESDPTSDGISAVRAAKINLNSFGIRVSFKIYFNVT
jgi:hypothetical protein